MYQHRLFLLFLTLFSFNCFLHSEEYYTHSHFQKDANIKDSTLYNDAKKDPLLFWSKCAEEIHWFKKWDNVLNWESPYARWFENGKLNACYNCLDKHLPTKANQIAFYWESETGEARAITYAELYDKVCRFANSLKKLGVQKGDRVAIYMPMVPEAVVSMIACARIGAVHSVIFGGIGAGAVREKIQDADAKVLITADGGYRRGKLIPYKESVEEILPQCPSLEHVVLVKRTGTATPFLSTRDVWYDDLMAAASSDCPCEEMDAEDLLFILYTSGTTGKAKGIIHTTGGYMVGVHNTFKWVFDVKPNDIYFCTADVGWITGHSYILYGPMSNGVTQVIYEGTFDFPNKSQCWKLIEKYKATIFYTAPTLIRTFMKWGPEWIAQANLSSLRLLGSIGEPLNPEAWHWFHDYVGHERCPIVDTWFQTETGAFVIAPIPGLTPLKPGSISVPLPGMEADILDDAGNENLKGFLAIKRPFPSMMRGVFKDPQRYVRTYWNKWEGRYYFAGDAARKDLDGYIWIGGRADEVIKVAGHRIGTAEVENALIQNLAVAESAVIGINDPLKGQMIVAFVILKKGETASEAELKKSVADYLGSYAKPELIAFVNDLPKTRSGKILRRLLKNLIEEEPLGDILSLENKQALEELVAKCNEVREQIKAMRTQQ